MYYFPMFYSALTKAFSRHHRQYWFVYKQVNGIMFTRQLTNETMTDRMNLSYLMDENHAAQPYTSFDFPSPAMPMPAQHGFGYPPAHVSPAAAARQHEEELHALQRQREIAAHASSNARNQAARLRAQEQRVFAQEQRAQVERERERADHELAVQLASEHRRSRASTSAPKRYVPAGSRYVSEAETRSIIKSLKHQGTAAMPPMPRADSSASWRPDLDPRDSRTNWLQNQRNARD